MKKILALSLTLVLAIVMLFGAAVPVSASAMTDLCDDFPDGPLTVSFDRDGGYNASYVRATISDGSIIADGSYEAWCADTSREINLSDTFAAMAYCSYASLPAGLVTDEGKLDEVNWILNQDFVGDSSPGGYGTYNCADVQMAIWTLLEGTSPPQSAIDSLQETYDQDRVNEIVAAANANNGFMPGSGEKLVVLLSPVLEEVVGQTILITLDIPEEGDEGLTPGFWKNHTSCWCDDYSTDDLVGDVFTIPSPDFDDLADDTLLEALNYNGNGGGKDKDMGMARKLLRQAVAALLNACHDDIDYPMTETEIIDAVNAALATLDKDVMEPVKDELDAKNNLGGGIDAHCNPI